MSSTYSPYFNLSVFHFHQLFQLCPFCSHFPVQLYCIWVSFFVEDNLMQNNYQFFFFSHIMGIGEELHKITSLHLRFFKVSSRSVFHQNTARVTFCPPRIAQVSVWPLLEMANLSIWFKFCPISLLHNFFSVNNKYVVRKCFEII